MFADDLDRIAALHANGKLNDEEFSRAKARVLGGESASEAPAAPAQPQAAINSLVRSRSDRWIGGICGGLGRSTGIASWVWRMAFTLTLLAGGCGLLAYLMLWIFVPTE